MIDLPSREDRLLWDQENIEDFIKGYIHDVIREQDVELLLKKAKEEKDSE